MAAKSIRRLTAENLEARLTPAGDVNVVLSGNNLTITGDDLDNTIKITQVNATNTIHVEGVGTNVLLNGAGAAAFQDVTIADFSKLQIKIVSNSGADDVQVGQFVGDQVTAAKLTIDTGAGVDSVHVLNTKVDGNSSFTLGKNSEVEHDVLDAEECVFNGDVKVRSGDGDDDVFFQSNTSVDGKLDIDTFKGNDFVVVQNGTYRPVSIKLGEGNDKATVQNLTVSQGKLTISAGKGSDNDIIVSNVVANQEVAISLGQSDSAADTNKFTSTGLTTGKLSVKGGKGADTVNLTTLGSPIVGIKLGDALDQLMLNGLTAGLFGAGVASKLTIDLAGGSDALQAANVTLETVDVKLGSGNNLMTATTINAATKIKVTSGKDGDNVTANNITTPDLSVDLGAADDLLTVSILNVGVAGKLAVKGGAGIGDTLDFNTVGSTLPPLNTIVKSGFEIENII